MNQKIKRVLRWGYYLPSNIVNKMQYCLKGIKCGSGHETKGILYIKKAKAGTMTIGNNVRINSSDTANPIGTGNRTYIQIVNDGKVTIGNNTRFSNCAITSVSSVTIGDNVRIGSGVKIYDTDFHALNPYDRTAVPERGTVGTKPIFIDDYAFIGAGSFILKGVTIGKGAIIGAGSVVTKSVPKGEIWGGNPAKKIGTVPGMDC